MLTFVLAILSVIFGGIIAYAILCGIVASLWSGK